MCIIHVYHHSPCGHNDRNWPLTIQCHCEPVEKALRFFHDQNHYHLLDEQLSIRYGIANIENLGCPKACGERWPPSLPSPVPGQKIFPLRYWEWVQDTIDDLQGIQLHNDGMPPSIPRQHRLDAISQHKKDSGKRRMKALNLTDKTAGPYPIDQVDHIMEIGHQQALGQSLEPPSVPWNVVLHTVPWGCGRRDQPACLVGHTETNGPLCPYLLARRIRCDYRTDISNHLADIHPLNRGGAVNVPLGGEHPRQLIQAAPAFSSGPGQQLVQVALPPSFVDSLGAGVGSKGMVYWGMAAVDRNAGPVESEFFAAQFVGGAGEVFYAKQPGTGPAVYGQVARAVPPRGGGNGGQPYMTPTVNDWPMFTGGMNAEGHYGPGAYVVGDLW